MYPSQPFLSQFQVTLEDSVSSGIFDGVVPDKSPNAEPVKESYIDINISREWTREEINILLNDHKRWGFRINNLSRQQRNQWKDSTSSVAKKLIDEIGGQSALIWDLVNEGKEAFKLDKMETIKN